MYVYDLCPYHEHMVSYRGVSFITSRPEGKSDFAHLHVIFHILQKMT